MRGIIGMGEFGISATYFFVFFVVAMSFAFTSMKERKMILLEDIFGISLACCGVMTLCASKLWLMLLTPAVFIVFMAGFIALDSLKRVALGVISKKERED